MGIAPLNHEATRDAVVFVRGRGPIPALAAVAPVDLGDGEGHFGARGGQRRVARVGNVT